MNYTLYGARALAIPWGSQPDPRKQAAELLLAAPKEDCFLMVLTNGQLPMFEEFVRKFELKHLIQYRATPITNRIHPDSVRNLTFIVLSKTPFKEGTDVRNAFSYGKTGFVEDVLGTAPAA